MPQKKMAAEPRAPRPRVNCRRFSKLRCADLRAVMNRKFRRDNRRYLQEEILETQPFMEQEDE